MVGVAELGPETAPGSLGGDVDHFSLILHVFRQNVVLDGLGPKTRFFGILAGKLGPRGAGNAMYYC